MVLYNLSKYIPSPYHIKHKFSSKIDEYILPNIHEFPPLLLYPIR